MKLTPQEAARVRSRGRLVCSAAEVSAGIDRVAAAISAELADACPLILCVMTGGVYFTGQLLPRLDFLLELDYLHVTRYHQDLAGGALSWRAAPWTDVRGRSVLVVDDVLDQGLTLKAVRDRLLQLGAARCLTAVLVEKMRVEAKPVQADFVAVSVPDVYLFGAGMDVRGAWRNLPAIYELID